MVLLLVVKCSRGGVILFGISCTYQVPFKCHKAQTIPNWCLNDGNEFRKSSLPGQHGHTRTCVSWLNRAGLKSLLSRLFNFLFVHLMFLLVIRKSPSSGSLSYKKHARMMKTGVPLPDPSPSFLGHPFPLAKPPLSPEDDGRNEKLGAFAPSSPPLPLLRLPSSAAFTSCLHHVSFSPELLAALTRGLKPVCRPAA